MNIIGIDVGARRCHVATEQDVASLTTEQTLQLLATTPPATIVLELTGAYGRLLAEHAYQAGHTVLIAHDTDERAVRHLLRSQRKTDRLDARYLRHLAALAPALPGPHPHLTPYEELRPLIQVRTQAHTWRYLVELRAAIKTRNRVPLTEPLPLIEPIDQLIEQYAQRTIDAVPPTIMTLLQSIPGVTPALAALLYATLGDASRFRSRDGAVSYAGVAPRHAPQSSTITGRKRRYRHAKLLATHLHMYALKVARNPHRYGRIGATYQRVRHRTDGPRALHAVKRHLIRITVGVLRSGTPHNPTHTSRAAGHGHA
jgi:transposase